MGVPNGSAPPPSTPMTPSKQPPAVPSSGCRGAPRTLGTPHDCAWKCLLPAEASHGRRAKPPLSQGVTVAPGGAQDHPVSLGSPAADPAALKQAPASGGESRAFPGATGFDSEKQASAPGLSRRAAPLFPCVPPEAAAAGAGKHALTWARGFLTAAPPDPHDEPSFCLRYLQLKRLQRPERLREADGQRLPWVTISRRFCVTKYIPARTQVSTSGYLGGGWMSSGDNACLVNNEDIYCHTEPHASPRQPLLSVRWSRA